MTEHHETWLKGVIKLAGGMQLDLRGTYALLSDGRAVDTAVVFVHGFLGDSQGTWLNFQEFICKPAASGEPWTNCDVFFFTYPSFRQDITESATQLLGFLNHIFPRPPADMFKTAKHVPGLPDIYIDLRRDKPRYSRLVLVAHSEGGVVVRRAVDLAYSWQYAEALQSRLALFAPAHRGIKLSGWIGACLAVGRIDAIATPILRFSPAFSEMKDNNLLEEIEKHTDDYIALEAAKGQVPTALRAHVVFGESESVVGKGYYTSDCYHPSRAGKDHSSVCKPQTGYDAPLGFVLDRVKGLDTCTGFKHS
jgi:hypothetical protein